MLELFAKTFDPTDFYTALTPTQICVVRVGNVRDTVRSWSVL